MEGDQLLVRLEAALSSYTCAIPLTVLSEQSTSCAWQEDPSAMRHLVEVGGAAWDQSGQDLVRTLSRLSSLGASAHDLGLPAGDVLSVGGDGVWVDGPGLYIFNGINFVNATLQPPAAADGNAVWSDGSRTLASGPDGAFIVDENGTSGRLPYQQSVDGVSKIPLVALAITGGGTGLGLGMARAFGAVGAKLVIASRSSEHVEAGAETLRAAGIEVLPLVCDVRDPDQVEEMVGTAVDHFGRLDVVVNNAGFLRDRMFVSTSEDEWDAVINVHLKGHFCVTRHACEVWRKQSKAGESVDARIINTSSGAGLQGSG